MRGSKLALLTALSLPSLVLADWPEFRGPGGQGHSPAQGLPLKWSETTNLSWKIAIPGSGWSSPVLANKQLWLTTAVDGGKSLRALCIEPATGKIARDVEVFHIEKPPRINAKNSYASPTPILEAGRLYVHFGTMGTACLDTDDGKVLWTNQELQLDHKEGPGGSPILWGELLIVNCDGMDVQYVVALDKKTGRIVWKTPRSVTANPDPDKRKAFSTPLLIRAGGHEQVVSIGADRTSAYDPATGKEIWWVNYSGYSNVARPVFGNDLVYLHTDYAHPQIWAVRPDGKGDVTKTNIVWRETKQNSTNSSALLVDDLFYTVTDQGIASARDAKTGRVLWSERLGFAVSASPVYADGRIYVCGETGKTSVLKPGPKFESLAVSSLTGGRVQASPAFDGSAIFLRTDSHLYKIEEKMK